MRKHCGTNVAILAAVACCVLMQTAAGDAHAAIIRLKSKATVNSGVVLLADVADVFDRNPQTANALRSVTLQPAPAPGSETRIDFSTIRLRLQAHGFNLAHLEFTGKSSVTVRAAADRWNQRAADRKRGQRTGPPATSWQVTRAKRLLSKAIRNYLRTARLGEIDMEVKLDAAMAPLVISGQMSGYEIRGGRPPWDAWQTLTVRFINRQEQLETIQVEARALTRPLVPMAQRSLPAGTVIGKRDIALKRADVATGSYPTVDEIIGRETTRAIRQGQMIGVDAIRQVPLVRRGDVVTALARVGGITVKQEMRSRSDGAMGERVMLRTLDGRDQIEATVVGYHEAAVLGVGSIPTDRAAGRDTSVTLRSELGTRRATPARRVGSQVGRRQTSRQTTANTSARTTVPQPVGIANQQSRLTTYTNLPYRNRRFR